MALKKSDLSAAIKNTFDSAKAENWSTGQIADALAAAIDTFVKSGDVVEVKSDVQVDLNTGKGTGTQSNKGKIL